MIDEKTNEETKETHEQTEKQELDIKAILETEEAKRHIQPLIDRTVTKALETYRANKEEQIKKELEEKINPKETPEQKELRELRERLGQLEKSKTQAELKSQAIEKLSDSKLPREFIRYIRLEEGTLDSQITGLKNHFEEAVNNAVSGEVSKITGKPRGTTRQNVSNPYGYNPWDAGTINRTKQIEIMRENPTLAENLKSIAKKQ